MGEWKLIESAPLDGTPVLLWLDPPLDTGDAVGYSVPGAMRVVVGWASDDWRNSIVWHCGFCEDGTADSYGASSQFMIKVTPTHWMPLPSPPTL